MAQQITLNKDTARLILSQFVENANTKGCYTLKDAMLLKRAADYFSKDVKEKIPLVENDVDPEGTAENVLVSGVQVAQSKGAYSLSDSAMLFQVVSYLEAMRKNEPIMTKADLKGKGPASAS